MTIPRTTTPNLKGRMRVWEVVDSEGVCRLVVEREDPPPIEIVLISPHVEVEPPEFEMPEGSE